MDVAGEQFVDWQRPAKDGKTPRAGFLTCATGAKPFSPEPSDGRSKRCPPDAQLLEYRLVGRVGEFEEHMKIVSSAAGREARVVVEAAMWSGEHEGA